MGFNISVYRTDIEAIKLALQTLSRQGIGREEVIFAAIGRMMEYYEMNQEQEYLLGAILQIQAYLELGFPYERHRGVFNKILHMYGVEKEDVFPDPFYSAKEIKKNYSQVRSMMGAWSNPRGKGMSISQTVRDILEKLVNMKAGVYYYKNHIDSPCEEIYELVINEKECYFHDIGREKYYIFK